MCVEDQAFCSSIGAGVCAPSVEDFVYLVLSLENDDFARMSALKAGR